MIKVEVRSSRRTLGYREVEKVLPLYTTLLIFGEVSVKTGTTNEVGALELCRQHVSRPRRLMCAYVVVIAYSW